MNKEEYAMLHYLLAKLKYSLFESIRKFDNDKLINILI